MHSISKKDGPPVHPPISFGQRNAIRTLLKRFMDEHGAREGKGMSPQACAEYISGGGEISKSVINGLLGTQATNLADLARIRDFLLTVFSDVDASSFKALLPAI